MAVMTFPWNITDYFEWTLNNCVPETYRAREQAVVHVIADAFIHPLYQNRLMQWHQERFGMDAKQVCSSMQDAQTYAGKYDFVLVNDVLLGNPDRQPMIEETLDLLVPETGLLMLCGPFVKKQLRFGGSSQNEVMSACKLLEKNPLVQNPVVKLYTPQEMGAVYSESSLMGDGYYVATFQRNN